MTTSVLWCLSSIGQCWYDKPLYCVWIASLLHSLQRYEGLQKHTSNGGLGLLGSLKVIANVTVWFSTQHFLFPSMVGHSVPILCHFGDIYGYLLIENGNFSYICVISASVGDTLLDGIRKLKSWASVRRWLDAWWLDIQTNRQTSRHSIIPR